MFDVIYLQEISPYLVVASLLMGAPALLFLHFFIASHMKPVQQHHIEKYDCSVELQLTIQKIFNESSTLLNWITICGGRKEGADEGPCYVLLENKTMFNYQGGQKWKINQYPLFSEDLLY